MNEFPEVTVQEEIGYSINRRLSSGRRKNHAVRREEERVRPTGEGVNFIFLLPDWTVKENESWVESLFTAYLLRKVQERSCETEFTRGETARPSERVKEGIFRIYLQLSRIDSSIVLTSCSGAWPDDSLRGEGNGIVRPIGSWVYLVQGQVIEFRQWNCETRIAHRERREEKLRDR